MEAVPALCVILVSSASPQIRQTAAVVLRRRLGKKNYWSRINTQTRTQYVIKYILESMILIIIYRIKQGMLEALVKEQEKLVKNSIAQLIGLLGKHEFPQNTWPEILQFIHQMCTSSNILDKEVNLL